MQDNYEITWENAIKMVNYHISHDFKSLEQLVSRSIAEYSAKIDTIPKLDKLNYFCEILKSFLKVGISNQIVKIMAYLPNYDIKNVIEAHILLNYDVIFLQYFFSFFNYSGN